MQFVRSLIARDDSPRTAHEVASETNPAALPTRIAEFAECHRRAVQSRRNGFEAWQIAAQQAQVRSVMRDRGVGLSRDSSGSLDL